MQHCCNAVVTSVDVGADCSTAAVAAAAAFCDNVLVAVAEPAAFDEGCIGTIADVVAAVVADSGFREEACKCTLGRSCMWEMQSRGTQRPGLC